MTKKTKQTLSMLNRHHSQTVNPNTISHSTTPITNHKKSIRKPAQQLQLIDKVELLKEKSHKFYKHVSSKIDRMIEIIAEVQQKHLAQYHNTHSRNGQTENKQQTSSHEQQPINLQQHQSLPPASVIHQSLPLSSVIHQSIPLSSVIHQSLPLPKIIHEQRQLVSKTLTQLHNLLTYQRPLSHIKHEFQSFYSRLSAFAKELQPEQDLSSDKKFLIPQNGITFEELVSIQQLIKEHYLRSGYFQVAQMFDTYADSRNGVNTCKHEQTSGVGQTQSKPKNHNSNTDQLQKFENIMKLSSNQNCAQKPHKKPKAQLLDLQQNFKQCFTLRQQLLTGNFTEAISWCNQERLYQTHQNPLEYNLRMAETKLLIGASKYRLAFEKVEKEMVKFLDNYEEEINMLIGYLLFSCEWNPHMLFGQQTDELGQVSQQQRQMFKTIVKSRYSKFEPSTVDLPALASTFTHEYFIHYGISQFDTLQICYRVGKMYQNRYFDSIQLFSERDRQQFLKHRGHCQLNDKNSGVPHSVVLPFQIPVTQQHLYHSIFVCPVTKEVLSSNDGVEYFSCGHLVSESAKKNMAEVRRSNHKQKCPVCQKDRTSDVVKVRF